MLMHLSQYASRDSLYHVLLCNERALTETPCWSTEINFVKSITAPAFPVSESRSSLPCSISKQSSFSVQAKSHHLFFASATIGSISNFVTSLILFNRVIQLTVRKKTKRSDQNWMAGARKNLSVVFPSHLRIVLFTDMCCTKHAF